MATRLLTGTAGEILVSNAGGSSPETVALISTAVTPGTYGDSTHVARFTVDDNGRLTDAQNVAVSGGTSGQIKTYVYTFNGSAPTQSLLHAGVGDLTVGDIIQTGYFDGNNADPESGGRFQVLNTTPGVIGTLTVPQISSVYTLVLQGTNYQLKVLPQFDSILDVRSVGIRCVEGVTGWHSRFATCVTWANSRNSGFDNLVGPARALTGAGVLSCTETVSLQRANWFGARCRFQGGTHQPNGGVVGLPTFFTAGITSANTAVTITAGTPINVAQTAHGFSANQQIMLGIVPGGKLAGNLAVLTTYYVIPVDANNYNLASTSGGAALNNATAGVAGQAYAYYSTAGLALPSQSNILTEDVLRWDGKISRLGVVVSAASNGANKSLLQQTITCWGDGNSDYTTVPSTICIRQEDDDSCNGIYNYSVCYTAIGLGIKGAAEKQTLNVRGIYNRCSIYVLNQSSADTLHIILNNQDCQAHYIEHDGVDTSVTLDMRIESRDDPANDAGSWGADAPAIFVRNGKFTKIMGDMRGGNGARTILIWGVLNSNGTSLRIGADTVEMDVHLVQGSGIAFEARAVRYLTGNVEVRAWDDTTGALAPLPCPAVIIGRVLHAGNFILDGLGINNTGTSGVGGGLRIGTTSSYYSNQANLGTYAIDMGRTLYQFSTTGTALTGSSGNPTTLTAWEVQKWNQCQVSFKGSRGNGLLDAGSVGGQVYVDNQVAVVPYTVTNNSTGTTVTAA